MQCCGAAAGAVRCRDVVLLLCGDAVGGSCCGATVGAVLQGAVMWYFCCGAFSAVLGVPFAWQMCRQDFVDDDVFVIRFRLSEIVEIVGVRNRVMNPIIELSFQLQPPVNLS